MEAVKKNKITKLHLGNINLETAYNGSAFQCLTQKPFIQTGNVWLFHPELTAIH